MCRADGTTILAVVRSGCVECGETPEDPQVVGWLDTGGTFTPGALPVDAGPCEAGCVDTVCRQMCDDSDGDGSADATYSELWCIRADGSAELVLTYQDDPSVPYTPTSPVDCLYGCPDSETVTLCDSSGPFLRRYTWLQGTASYEDFALDGATPHVITGTVGVCSSGGGPGGDVTTCCSPSIASTPLCRDDGTTVLLVVRSGCADCGTTPADPAVVGWIDAATGLFTAGPAPVDAGPCTAGCLDTVCRLRCDDSDGDGLADATYSELWCIHADGTATLVLTYQDDPSVPYVPTAPVDCEHGLVTSQAVTLCDASGPFLRLYQWVNGVASFTDVALDGASPHTVTGTVSTCAGQAEPGCAEQTTPTAAPGLCLADGTPIAVILTRDCAGAVTQDGWINLTTGVFSAGAPPAGAAACGDSRAFELAGVLCDVDPATGAVLGLALVEYEYNADGSLASVRLVDPGTGNTYTLRGELRFCPAGDDEGVPESDMVVLCDTASDGTVTEFLRDFHRDANGQVTGHTDYALDGSPYTAAGTVGLCSPPAEPCRTSTALLLCDLPTDGQPTTTVTDTPPAPYYPYPTGAPVAGAQPLWDGGGTLTIPAASAPQPGMTGAVATLAATLQAARPACDSGTAHVTVSVRVAQLGPDTGCAATGYLRLFNGPASPVALAATPTNTPAGWSGRLTVEADVPAADLAAGNIGVLVALDTYDDSPGPCPGSPRRTGWDLAQFTATTVYDQTGCAVQFLRTVTVDCEGAVIATADSTLDGQPYTPTGEPGQCTAAGGGGSCCPEQPCPAQSVVEACRCDDTDGDGLPDVGYVELLAVDCTGTLTSLGTYTENLAAPYTPVAPVDCGALDDEEGAPPAYGVQARRVELAPGGSWSAAAWPTLQSVTAVAHGGTGTITTADGPSTLHQGEAATWSTARDDDARLTGPLTIAADSGTVTIAFTLGGITL
ncbi:hypothetical protein [Streptomyces eurythermus]